MDRIDKINEAMKKEVSLIIQEEIHDPRLEFITITSADVSRDLQHAKVYFSVLGDAKKAQEAQAGLDSARGFIRKLVGQRIRMRYTPEIAFFYDKSIEYSAQIDDVIDRIKNELKENH